MISDNVLIPSVFRSPRNRAPSRSTLLTLADEDLMQLVHDGKPAAFEVIFDRHGDAAFSLAYRMCGRRAMAEDIVQEAFVSLWRSGARYDRGRGSVRSWVLSVVHNRAIDAFRRDVARSSLDVSDEAWPSGWPPRSEPRPRLNDVTKPARCAPPWASSRPSSAR
jgi:DNA-directed RNA polymerase specialized sigma24 family protein